MKHHTTKCNILYSNFILHGKPFWIRDKNSTDKHNANYRTINFILCKLDKITQNLQNFKKH